jgi:hypothetical protein
MAALATIAAVVGTVASIGSAIYTGQQLNEAAQIEAHNLEVVGREEFAAAQREAQERRLEGKLLESRQLAVAAASGAGAGLDDPTIVKLLTTTGELTEYAVSTIGYRGERLRDAYYRSADAKRRGGEASLFGSYLSAFGELGAGGANIASTLN